jgi:hypothetical protein
MSIFSVPKSGVVIARLLNCEGWTPHVSNQVRKWALNNCCNRKIERRAKRNIAAFKEMAKRMDLSPSDRLVLGAFIGTMSRAGFEAGLRVGLATTFNCPERVVEPAE